MGCRRMLIEKVNQLGDTPFDEEKAQIYISNKEGDKEQIETIVEDLVCLISAAEVHQSAQTESENQNDDEQYQAPPVEKVDADSDKRGVTMRNDAPNEDEEDS